MPSPKGSIVVTGANGGLGSATVARILQTPDLAEYTGIYTVRDAATATQLRWTLEGAPETHKHEIVEIDLGSIASVRKAAAGINAKVADGTLPPIRALVLNAAYQDATELFMTGDGYETTWQVNFLSNLMLSLMLLQSLDKDNGRILTIGSWAHDIEDARNDAAGSPYKDPRYPILFPSPEALAEGKWSTPQEDPTRLSGFRRYGASKLCAVMLMLELGEHLARDPGLFKIAVVGVDPGAMSSGLTRRNSAVTRFVITRVMPLLAPLLTSLAPNGAFRTTSKSAAEVMRACFEIEAPAGKPLYLNGSEESATAKETRDEAKRRELWQYGIRAAEIKDGETALADWH